MNREVKYLFRSGAHRSAVAGSRGAPVVSGAVPAYPQVRGAALGRRDCAGTQGVPKWTGSGEGDPAHRANGEQRRPVEGNHRRGERRSGKGRAGSFEAGRWPGTELVGLLGKARHRGVGKPSSPRGLGTWEEAQCRRAERGEEGLWRMGAASLEGGPGRHRRAGPR